MLERAKDKEVYTRPGLADNSYDAIISVGTFACGHLGPEAFSELIRITQPGGPFCFTSRDQSWEVDNYCAAMDKIENTGAW